MCQFEPLPASVVTFHDVLAADSELSAAAPPKQSPGHAHTTGGAPPPTQKAPAGQGTDPVAPAASTPAQ